MEIKEKIIKETSELFKRYGVRSITMDDIARHLSMSKRTLYQYFTDKETIVCEVARLMVSNDVCKINEIRDGSANFIDEMHQSLLYVKMAFKEINPSFVFDLRKYHPKAWEIMLSLRSEVLGHLTSMLQRGIEQGFVRPEIDVEVIALMRFEQVEAGMNPAIYPPDRFDLSHIQMQLLDHFIHGIITPKGSVALNQFIQKQESNTKINI